MNIMALQNLIMENENLIMKKENLIMTFKMFIYSNVNSCNTNNTLNEDTMYWYMVSCGSFGVYNWMEK